MIAKVISSGRHGSTLAYLLQAKGRSVAPAILRGDPELIRGIIDSSPSRNPYTTTVLSFAECAADLSPAVRESLINSFENMAFAGIDTSCVARIWIEHGDKNGRLELNCCAANLHLVSGKVLALYVHSRDALTWRLWQELTCRQHGLVSSDDPTTQRGYRLPASIPRRQAEIHQRLGQSLTKEVRAGRVRDRKSIVEWLEAESWQVITASKDTLSVRALGVERGDILVLRGAFYHEHWSVLDPLPAADPRLVKLTAELHADFAPRLAARARILAAQASRKPRLQGRDVAQSVTAQADTTPSSTHRTLPLAIMNPPQPNENNIGSDELLEQLLAQLRALATERDQLRAQLQEMTCDTTRMHALIEANISLERSARELTAENERLSARSEAFSRQLVELFGVFGNDDFVEIAPGDLHLASSLERITGKIPATPDEKPQPFLVNRLYSR